MIFYLTRDGETRRAWSNPETTRRKPKSPRMGLNTPKRLRPTRSAQLARHEATTTVSCRSRRGHGKGEPPSREPESQRGEDTRLREEELFFQSALPSLHQFSSGNQQGIRRAPNPEQQLLSNCLSVCLRASFPLKKNFSRYPGVHRRCRHQSRGIGRGIITMAKSMGQIDLNSGHEHKPVLIRP